MDIASLQRTPCAICGAKDNTAELYPANFDLQALNSSTFSARRLPDRIHYRIVKCRACGLVRSDPVVDFSIISRLYSQSTLNYDDEAESIRRTYGRYLAKLAPYRVPGASLLEVGCGNGFFLEEAMAQGYETVRGIEPSASAVAKARPKIQPMIVCDVMRSGVFDRNAFNVVCLFQVFDHVPEPGALLDECFRILKPGGLVLCINHNIEAVSARILQERSPIIDIEHTYLFSPATMSRIFVKHGFSIKNSGRVYNNYSLYYLIRILPLSARVKQLLLGPLRKSGIGKVRLSVPLGNLYLIAQKP